MPSVAPLMLTPTHSLATLLGMDELGDRIKALRKMRGMTREALALILKTTPGAIYQWEVGLTKPTSDKIPRIAKGLGVSPGELMSGDEESVTPRPIDPPADLSQDAIVRAIIQQALQLTPTKRRAVVEFLTKTAEVLDGLQDEEGPPHRKR